MCCIYKTSKTHTPNWLWLPSQQSRGQSNFVRKKKYRRLSSRREHYIKSLRYKVKKKNPQVLATSSLTARPHDLNKNRTVRWLELLNIRALPDPGTLSDKWTPYWAGLGQKSPLSLYVCAPSHKRDQWPVVWRSDCDVHLLWIEHLSLLPVLV